VEAVRLAFVSGAGFPFDAIRVKLHQRSAGYDTLFRLVDLRIQSATIATDPEMNSTKPEGSGAAAAGVKLSVSSL
jgi:hypothetical protein